MKKTADHELQRPIYKAFRENETILKRFLSRFTSNTHDIEDICQETIARALEAVKNTEINAPKAFLFGISKNIVRKKLDQESKTLIDFIEDFAPQEYISNEPPLEDVIDSQRRMVIFMEAVATLPDQCQKVFVLKKVYGYSHKEIASQLGLSTSTIEKHVAAGLKRCLEYMQKHDCAIDSNESFGGKTVSIIDAHSGRTGKVNNGQ